MNTSLKQRQQQYKQGDILNFQTWQNALNIDEGRFLRSSHASPRCKAIQCSTTLIQGGYISVIKTRFRFLCSHSLKEMITNWSQYFLEKKKRTLLGMSFAVTKQVGNNCELVLLSTLKNGITSNFLQIPTAWTPLRYRNGNTFDCSLFDSSIKNPLVPHQWSLEQCFKTES